MNNNVGGITKVIPMEPYAEINDDMLFARLCDSPEAVARRNSLNARDKRIARYNDFMTKAIIAVSASLVTVIAFMFMI